MARINPQDFVGTRARFQRLRDAKVFSGWIENFHGQKLDVSCSTQFAVELGDEFRLEGFGHHIAITFNAKLENIANYDILAKGGLSVIEGTNGRIIEATKTTLNLVITSPVKFTASPEAVRIAVQDYPTRIQVGSQDLTGNLADIGPNGIGVKLSTKIEPSVPVVLTIQTPYGPVRTQGVTKYCRIDPDRAELFRVGIMFTDLGRLERPRWDRFLNQTRAAS